MRKKIISVFLLTAMVFALTACNPLSFLKNSNQGEVITATDGQADGRIGDIMKNTFFQYTVKSAAIVDEYAGYTPEDGYILVDAVVDTKNVFTESIEMYDTDFQIQWGDGDEDYGYPIAALDDTMIPDTYELRRAESKEYHCVYEVPEGSTNFSISYLEQFTDGSEGDVFFVFFEL